MERKKASQAPSGRIEKPYIGGQCKHKTAYTDLFSLYLVICMVYLYHTVVQCDKVVYTISVVYEIPYKWDCADAKIIVTLHREN
jgi:hypothetical protein